MLTIFTSTFCRPDYVQLLAYCLNKTVDETYKFVVYVQPNGLSRNWKYVDDIIYQKNSGYYAWQEILLPLSPSVILHDDCVPVLKWSSKLFTNNYCCRMGGSTLQYYIDNKSKHTLPTLIATRINQKKLCSCNWSDELCDAAVDNNIESLLDGTFLHIDKGTIGLPNLGANKYKSNLITAICKFLDIPQPEPLSKEELAIHPGVEIKLKDRPVDITKKPQPILELPISTKASSGPGTILKNLLKDWFGILSETGCKCNSMSLKMDKLGPDWCESEQGMSEILDVMKLEHNKRFNDGTIIIPWNTIIAKKLIEFACYRARHN